MNKTVEKILANKKPINLTQKEIDRAETSYAKARKYTIIRRLQANGKYLVAAVDIYTRMAIEAMIVLTKEDCNVAVQQVNRWMDKNAKGGKMSSKSRHRA
jgi:hypothetical protein